MARSEHDPESPRRDHDIQIQRQIAFASGLFQGDVTIRTLFESLAEGVVIIDTLGTILLVNPRAEEMFGYPNKELIGKRLAVLLPERLSDIHEDHVARFFEDPRIRPMGQLLDLVGQRRDGIEFPVEISLSFLETINGFFAMAFISDISNRKKVEAQLRESEESIRTMVEGVKDYAILMLDANGNVLSWNAGAGHTLGFRPDEIIGRHFSCFYSDEERECGRPEEDLGKAQVEGWFEAEGWRLRKDGRRFWADVVLSALFNSDGNLRGFTMVVRDITMRRQAGEEIGALNAELAARAADLEEANSELETFNSMVSHDLRNPLNSISGFCQVLQSICVDKLDGECMGYIQQIYDTTLRMNRLIDTLLDFSRILHVEIHNDRVALSKIAKKVAASKKMMEPERRVTFRIIEGITVDGDAGLLNIVMENLIGNAWKFTANWEGTVIEFGVLEQEGKPAYFIRDNGPGFDMADADKLFVPFKRLNTTTVQGHGVGLATVERIIRRHGGRVWAEGDAGKGATFYFTIHDY